MDGYTMRGHAPRYGIKIAGQFAASKTREAVKMYGKFQAGNAQPHFKRSHKKSRMGCVTCKQRRVKVRGRSPTQILIRCKLTPTSATKLGRHARDVGRGA